VFTANAVVFVVAVAVLAWTPVTVHRVATPSELVVLGIGLVLMLTFDLVLPAAGVSTAANAWPRRCTPLIRRRRKNQAGSFESASAEVRALAEALEGMLSRLERERRDSALRELAAQERERLRIASELHDEVGQMLTAIALRAERAARRRRRRRPGALLEISETALSGLETCAESPASCDPRCSTTWGW